MRRGSKVTSVLNRVHSLDIVCHQITVLLQLPLTINNISRVCVSVSLSLNFAFHLLTTRNTFIYEYVGSGDVVQVALSYKCEELFRRQWETTRRQKEVEKQRRRDLMLYLFAHSIFVLMNEHQTKTIYTRTHTHSHINRWYTHFSHFIFNYQN